MLPLNAGVGAGEESKITGVLRGALTPMINSLSVFLHTLQLMHENLINIQNK